MTAHSRFRTCADDDDVTECRKTLVDALSVEVSLTSVRCIGSLSQWSRVDVIFSTPDVLASPSERTLNTNNVTFNT